MDIELKFFISPWKDPCKNLAFEDQLLKSIEPHQKVLMLYQNDPCVVMGRFQNPWRELNLHQLDNIRLVRRQSGGGTVYHDEGNLCFSFLHGSRDHHKDVNNEIILNALKTFNIEARSSNRSDLVLSDGRKFSGSAFKQKKDSSFHHGTLLIESNLSVLNSILDSPLKKLEGKGILSNPSKVINLKTLSAELNRQSLILALKDSFEEYYEKKCLPIDEDFQNFEYEEFLSSWEWVIGETPEFVVRESSFDLVVKKAIIEKIEIKNAPENIKKRLEAKLLGCLVRKETLDKVFSELFEEFKEPALFELEDQLRIYFY